MNGTEHQRNDTGQRAFRAWVRAHHPDLGGDPAEFAAGLARWRPGCPGLAGRDPASAAGTRVTAFRARRGWWLVDRWWRRRASRLRKSWPLRTNGKVSGRVR